MWTTPDPELTALLNEATESSPKTHYSILELARHILHKVDLLDSAQILHVEYDSWQTEIPDDAVD